MEQTVEELLLSFARLCLETVRVKRKPGGRREEGEGGLGCRKRDLVVVERFGVWRKEVSELAGCCSLVVVFVVAVEMRVTVTFGKQKVHIDSDVDMTVGELKHRLGEEMGMEDGMTLVHDGRKLLDENEVVSSSARMMLLMGKSADEDVDKKLGELGRLENQIAELDEKRSKIRSDWEQAKKGSLKVEEAKHVFLTLDKKVAGYADQLLLCLEAIDAVHHSKSEIVKARRRACVAECQAKMRLCDLLREEIQTSIRDEHEELAHQRG